ncbi:MAG: hypothetical protein IPM51_15735 [Sphingobacteriaceae bacterium]|nr:hypothetical protein [Sphingobacteriaceae bacterium]
MPSKKTQLKLYKIQTVYLVTSFILFFVMIGKAQIFDTISLQQKKNFLSELMEQKQLDDVIYLARKLNNQIQNESLFLLQIQSQLLLRKEKEALVDLQNFNIIDSSGLGCTKVMLKNHAYLMLGLYDSINEPSCIKHLQHKEQWKIQLMAAMLFQKKWDDFDLLFNNSKCSDPICSVSEFALYIQKQKLAQLKTKKRFLAGLLSAIIPGTGKIYAGKPREAFYSFLPVVANFAQAAEGYYYKKLDSPHLYFFGTVGTVFYASNIYGSAKAAKRKNEEIKIRNNNNIEFEIYKLIKYY